MSRNSGKLRWRCHTPLFGWRVGVKKRRGAVEREREIAEKSSKSTWKNTKILTDVRTGLFDSTFSVRSPYSLIQSM